MVTRIQKWGNSLALRIPKAFAEDTNIEQDALVEVTLEGGRLIVTPVPRQEWTLEQLLSGITDENLHREVNTGEAVGNEAW